MCIRYLIPISYTIQCSILMILYCYIICTRYRIRWLVYPMFDIWNWAGHNWQTSLAVCLWFHVTWTTAQSIQFFAASAVRSQRKLQQILDPTVGLGAGCSKSTCGCGAMEGPFLVKFLWIKLWNCAKRGCMNQQESRARGAETLRRKRDRAWAKGASALQWMILAECYFVSDIVLDMYEMTFDIKRQCDLQYRIRYQHTISKCVCPISNIQRHETVQVKTGFESRQVLSLLFGGKQGRAGGPAGPSAFQPWDLRARHKQQLSGLLNASLQYWPLPNLNL
jgi:hypothetical protein